jgi:ATP-binding cassette, subfamily B, bacterial
MKLKRLLALISPPASVLALCLGLLTVGSIIALVQPWLAGQATGLITESGDTVFPNFIALALTWFCLIIGRSALNFVTSYKIGAVAEDVLAALRARLYEHLQLLPLRFFDDQKRGDVLSILTNDAAAISNFVTGTLVRLLPALLTLVGAGFMLCWTSLKIGLITLAFLPLYVLVTKIISRKIRPLAREWVDTYGQMVAHAEENLGLLPTIKSFTREIQESQSFSSKNNALLSLSKRQLFIYTLLPSVTMLLAGLGILVLVAVGVSEIRAGQLTPSNLVSLLFFAMLLIQPLSQLANAWGQLQRTRGASERVMEFLNQQPEPLDKGNQQLQILQGEICFKRVVFGYTPDRPVLANTDFMIHPKETVAIVGENGAGKSTLAHLIMRLIEPSAGQIFIDSVDISQVSLRSLRSQIGLVAQHTLLLNGTIAENISWGKALASHDEIEAAARKAHAHDFICKLTDGYDTIIGDQGLKLSGGQRQRLSLARALLKNPQILILDEATSMFDPAAEAAFLEDCSALFADRTVLLITHRPASLAVADRVLLLADGELSELADVNHYLITGKNQR